MTTPVSDAVRSVFVGAGLRVNAHSLKYSSEGTIIAISGWHKDGTPFAFASAPFNSNPAVRAREIAVDLIRAHSGIFTVVPDGGYVYLTKGKTTMGKLETVAGRLSGLKARLEQRADKMAERITDVEKRGDEAFAKQEAVLTQAEREIDEMEKSLAQLTNGAPAE